MMRKKKKLSELNVETSNLPVEETSELSILKCMEVIVSKCSSLTPQQTLEQYGKEATYIADILSITPLQAVFLSVLTEQYEDDNISLNDISEKFCDSTQISMLNYVNEMEALVEHGYILQAYNRRKLTPYCYKIAPVVLSILKTNEPVPVKKKNIKNLSEFDFFDMMFNYYEDRREELISTELLYSNLHILVDSNKQLDFCKKLNKYSFSNEQDVVCIFLFFCVRLYIEQDEKILISEICDLFDTTRATNRIRSSFSNNNHILITQNIIENHFQEGFFSNEFYNLSEPIKDNLFPSLQLNRKVDKEKNIMKYDEIKVKELYYNSKEAEQINQLTSLLTDENFVKIQQRLDENGIRRGFACLFYGAPGTGKTETVYQLARLTNSDVFCVDSSTIKNKYVGETEKRIKDVFDRYRRISNISERTPILLFNEADGILGQRFKSIERSVDKMENTMQNIILEEMEKLDGIMIATTNLTNNLDTAFERRFLYKVQFNKPIKEAKIAIWKSMIPSLPDEWVNELAGVYDFSGGQIENITRKYTIYSILNNTEPSFRRLKNFCDEEVIIKKTNKHAVVGFVNNSNTLAS